jgi:hypothetical protein
VIKLFLKSRLLLASLAKKGEVFQFSGFARKLKNPSFFASEASNKTVQIESLNSFGKREIKSGRKDNGIEKFIYRF